MKRDFTLANYERFRKMIDEIHDKQFAGYSDATGDAGNRVKHYLGDLGLHDKMTDLDRYHREMLDMENRAGEQIRQTFEEASALDDRYGGADDSDFGLIKAQYAGFRRAVQSLQELTRHARSAASEGKPLDSAFDAAAISAILNGSDDPLVRRLIGSRSASDGFGAAPSGSDLTGADIITEGSDA